MAKVRFRIKDKDTGKAIAEGTCESSALGILSVSFEGSPMVEFDPYYMEPEYSVTQVTFNRMSANEN